ncbi:tRNA (adenine(22)-N(1))-methyltransferase [Paenibacillus sp. CN-4]|uniref:tRNA (adenine(22)-N(1))-methyltransferase n=1 Tax=Paenibacillus nanchangensis TaxID=3348343 RepID=UPI003978F534
MNNTKLSRRLTQLLEQIPPGSRLADIGSDHALLPVAAVQSGRAVSAIAGEVNAGPFEAARKGVQDSGYTGTIEVRLGDGLEVLQPGEADCVTIAGMGGALIASILERGRRLGRLEGVSRLLLQPNVGEDMLRRWLADNGWLLVSERILEEDGKIYEVLHAVREESAAAVPPGDSAGLASGELPLTNAALYAPLALDGGRLVLERESLLRFGPWLLREPDPVFFAKWNSEIGKLEGILRSLSRSELASAEAKRAELTRQIEEITEVLQCLQKDKR